MPRHFGSRTLHCATKMDAPFRLEMALRQQLSTQVGIQPFTPAQPSPTQQGAVSISPSPRSASRSPYPSSVSRCPSPSPASKAGDTVFAESDAEAQPKQAKQKPKQKPPAGNAEVRVIKRPAAQQGAAQPRVKTCEEAEPTKSPAKKRPAAQKGSGVQVPSQTDMYMTATAEPDVPEDEAEANM